MARQPEVLLTDTQWERLRPLIPEQTPKRRGGRPRTDDRACLEGILCVLRSGSRWRDLPEWFPSLSTCWRRLVEWEATGVLEEVWHVLLDQLDEQGLLCWEKVLVDGTFAPAKKGGTLIGKTKRGKGTKCMVGDSEAVPLAWRAASGSPAEVTLVEGVLDSLADGDPETPIPLFADRAYDSDRHRTRLLQRGWDPVCPHCRGRKRPKLRTDANSGGTADAGRSNAPSAG